MLGDLGSALLPSPDAGTWGAQLQPGNPTSQDPVLPPDQLSFEHLSAQAAELGAQHARELASVEEARRALQEALGLAWGLAPEAAEAPGPAELNPMLVPLLGELGLQDPLPGYPITLPGFLGAAPATAAGDSAAEAGAAGLLGDGLLGSGLLLGLPDSLLLPLDSALAADAGLLPAGADETAPEEVPLVQSVPADPALASARRTKSELRGLAGGGCLLCRGVEAAVLSC